VGTEALVGPLLMVYTTTYREIGCDSKARLPGPTAGTQVGNRNCIHDKNLASCNRYIYHVLLAQRQLMRPRDSQLFVLGISPETKSLYRSASSSSGSGIWAASAISFWYCSSTAWSTWTSGGARAGAATKSRDWLPTSLRASQLG
jgi:hypothetical protein